MLFTRIKFKLLNCLNKDKKENKNSNIRSISKTLTNNLIKYSIHNNEKIFKEFSSSFSGLTERTIQKHKEKYGLNEINFEETVGFIKHLLQCYTNPFNLLLTALAIFQALTQDYVGTVIISIMVILATFIRFFQEQKSKIAINNLKVMVSNKVSVVRQEYSINRECFSVVKEIAIKELLPGDIINLSAGDMIPADIRIITAKDLFISQSVITGESMPVEKFAEHISEIPNSILSLNNIAFMGSNVISGSAKAIVVTTGNNTYFGNLSSKLTSPNKNLSQFQKGINKVSWLLVKLMLIMVPIVLLINGFTKGDWLDATLFALSVAVGLTPEMLPMIVTATLAKGASFMAKKKVIVKKLEALQNFGAMDILCTDKTGTLTQDKIILERHIDVSGNNYDKVLDYAYINSFYQTGLKNLLDVAVLSHVEVNKKLDIYHNYYKVDEIPFDFNRRRMSVVVKESNENNVLICKGALEEVISVSSFVKQGEVDIPLTEEVLKKITKTTDDLNKEGLRVVAVAIKKEPLYKEKYSVKDETELTLMGYIAFLDPPKESTTKALKAIHKNGIAIKILTGDNELVTRKICKDVNFNITNVLTGEQINQINDQELTNLIDSCNVFVKLTPDHKERIVNVLKVKKHIVGFLGDGINDAPALRAADIGISVDSAVDIAKESADLILLEKSLMVLEEGVREGRKTFANMLKYIKITTSSNLGNVFTVLLASVFLPFLPMLPVQILIQNLLYDISQVAIPFDNVDEEVLSKPQKWDPKGIFKFMICFGPLSSIFDVITFFILWYVYNANSANMASFFQTGWFLEGLLSQICIVHIVRTKKIPFVNSISSNFLLFTSVFIGGLGVLFTMSSLGRALGFVSIPLSYYFFVLLIVTFYLVTAQLVKKYFISRYGWN